MDADGYPEEAELQKISKWVGSGNGADFKDLMAFVKSIWWMPSWGWHESTVADEIDGRLMRRYNISTGGWSGNEEIIGALRDNLVFWIMCWFSERRGGHFVFEIPER